MPPRRELPSCADLDRLFSYNPETGDFLWKFRAGDTQPIKAFNTKFAGKPAGHIMKKPPGQFYRAVQYRSLWITEFNQRCFVHRIIWKMMTGQEPPEFIDHKDGDGLNQRWNNLRAATNGENMCNAPLRKNNTSGIKGVTWNAERSKWQAQIGLNGKTRVLGKFKTLEEATAIANEARIRLHGEFARLG